MAETGAKQPFHALSPGDRAPIVIIVAYSWISISLIVAVIRFTLVRTQRLPFKADDGAYLLGLMLAIGSSVAFHIAANGGLGKHITALDQAGLDQAFKATYAAELVGIAAMASAKLSYLLLCDRVAPREPRPFVLMLGIVAFYAVFSLFATAFQCSLPRPWFIHPAQCPAHGNLQYPIILFNIITDALLATWMLPTLKKLLMESDKRNTVMALFGSRVIVCFFAIVQLVLTARHAKSEDVTYDSFGGEVWALCVIHLSVLLAAIPRMNRFISALHSAHTTTVLTDFELAYPNGVSIASSKAVSAAATDPSKTRSHDLSKSRSPTRISRSPEAHRDMPLRLTPSANQHFSTHVTSPAAGPSNQQSRAVDSNKPKTDDWRKYLRRGENEKSINLGSMFSRSSKASQGGRTAQNTQASQEAEPAPPRESRWVKSKPRQMNRAKK